MGILLDNPTEQPPFPRVPFWKSHPLLHAIVKCAMS